MRDDPAVVALVGRANRGDQTAWDEIVERYAPLVWAICARHHLYAADAEEVGSIVWLHLVERLNTLREPAALPGWIATTTRNACLHQLRTNERYVDVDVVDLADTNGASVDDMLVTQERRIALRSAFVDLSDRCKQLLSLLFADPPTPYTEISATVGIAVGSIGPTRNRCLNTLRANSALASFRDINSPARKGETT